VVGDCVIVTASSGAHQDELHVICFDVTTGDRRWHRRFWATGRTLCHPTSAVAAPTPASDGQRIFAFYSSCDLACFDLDGNPLWYRGLAEDYARVGNDTGMSSSPLVIDETVIVQVESQGNSLVAGIDVATGVNRWNHPRRSVENWTSPVLYRPARGADDDQLPDLGLLQSPWGLTALDPRTGRVLWQYEVSCEAIPSLTVDEGVLYVPAAGMTALRTPEQADVAIAEVVWRQSRLRTDAASPVVDQDKLYTLNNRGVLTGSDTASGRIGWRLRLKGRFWATPVMVGSHLLLVNSDGLVQIVEVSGNKGKLIGTSDLGAPIQATPAVSGGALYFRSDHHLWKFAAP
jgi:outer membrane protein assembly factor BamB